MENVPYQDLDYIGGPDVFVCADCKANQTQIDPEECKKRRKLYGGKVDGRTKIRRCNTKHPANRDKKKEMKYNNNKRKPIQYKRQPKYKAVRGRLVKI